MKSMKILSLVLLATSLASGAVYARGGGGGGGMGGGGMGSGSASSADHSQQQTQERTQKRDGSGLQTGDAQRNEYRYENREQVRSENTLPSMQ